MTRAGVRPSVCFARGFAFLSVWISWRPFGSPGGAGAPGVAVCRVPTCARCVRCHSPVLCSPWPRLKGKVCRQELTSEAARCWRAAGSQGFRSLEALQGSGSSSSARIYSPLGAPGFAAAPRAPVLGAAEPHTLPARAAAVIQCASPPCLERGSKDGRKGEQGEGAGGKEGEQWCPDGPERVEKPFLALPCVASGENQKL